MRAHRNGTAEEAQSPLSDRDLSERAAAADSTAFGELYRRHAPAAWGVAQAVTADPADAAEAVSNAFTEAVMGAATAQPAGDQLPFRLRLLAATRAAAMQAQRRNGTDQPRVADRGLMDNVFRSLPERWRAVVWLGEAEGMAAGDLAGLMGMTPARAEDLAARAGAGLRERYLQASLAGPVRPECRFCVAHLGAYVADRLRLRHLAKTDQHLSGCEECCDRLGELADLGSSLRRLAAPLPLLVAADASARWRMATAAFATSTAAGTSSLVLQRAQKPLLVLSTGIFALGVISATVIANPDRPQRDRPGAAVALRPSNPQILPEPASFTTPVVDDLPPHAAFSAPVSAPRTSSESPAAETPVGGTVADNPAVASPAPAVRDTAPAATDGPAAGIVPPAVTDVVPPLLTEVVPIVDDVTELLVNLLADLPLGPTATSTVQPASTQTTTAGASLPPAPLADVLRLPGL